MENETGTYTISELMLGKQNCKEADEEDTMCYDLDEEFKTVVAPVIKWLNENAPSHLAVITANHAVLSEVTNVTAG